MPVPTTPPTVANERRVDLVCEGGGVKGIALVGALAVLAERGYRPVNVAGTSAGAIVATLLAAGYDAAELRDIIGALDFRRFADRAWEDHIPLVGAPLSILKDRGIFEGGTFLAYLRELLAARGVRTFGDLVHPDFADDGNAVYRHKVQVIAADLTERRLLVLPRDAGRLGIAPNELEVALAVRMSISIPVFFEPVRFGNPASGGQHLIVDGGLLSNYPVWLFDAAGEPAWPTFGLKLVEPAPTATTVGDRLPATEPEWGLGAVVGYAKSLVQTMLEAHDRLYIEQGNFERTIPISTLGVSATEFDLTPERAEALYAAGRTAATEFLASWDFERHKAERRLGGDSHRPRRPAATILREQAA